MRTAIQLEANTSEGSAEWGAQCRGYSKDSKAASACIHDPGFDLPHWATLGSLLRCSMPQFLYVENGHNGSDRFTGYCKN